MVSLQCANCGAREEKHVLPGKHAISGAISTLNRHSDCCKRPNYVQSEKIEEEPLDRNLREMVSIA